MRRTLRSQRICLSSTGRLRSGAVFDEPLKSLPVINNRAFTGRKKCSPLRRQLPSAVEIAPPGTT